MDGKPIAVGSNGTHAFVAVQTNNTGGRLQIVNFNTRAIVRTIELTGQPSDVDVDAQAKFAAVAVETTGEVLIVDLITPSPNAWPARSVSLSSVVTTPRPKAVSISDQGRCAVALPDDNVVVILDLNHRRGLRIVSGSFFPGVQIQTSWSAGETDVDGVDTLRNSLVELNSTLSNIARRPKSLAWTSPNTIATANNNSRGFSLFHRQGKRQFDSGNELEHLAAAIGHFPEHRVELLGVEPNVVVTARFGSTNYIFVSCQAAAMVAVYSVTGNQNPVYQQVLATPRSPTGLLAIPQRNLFLVSSDLDSRVGKFRAGISIYSLQSGQADYPTLISADRPDGTPIPWAGMSGLGADPHDSGIIYGVYDNRYRRSTILKIDLTQAIPTIVEEIPLINSGVIASLPLGLIDVDPEGVAVRPQGGFWVASEGNTPPAAPAIINDQLFQVAPNGVVEKEILLPASLRANPFRFGFEGVTCIEDGVGNELVYVCLQRKWPDDPVGFCKIAKYDVVADEWTFALYPLDAPTSPYPGTNWVGLSEITALDLNTLLILERDNQAGLDARIKRLYTVDISDVEFLPHGATLPQLTKTLWRDLIPDMQAPNGYVLEKVEGVAALPNGDVYIVVDNDGTTIFGETQLIKLN